MMGENMDNKFLSDNQEWHEYNQEWHEYNQEISDKFLQTWKERQEKAEWFINKIIESFVNSLGKDLTLKLVDLHENLKNQPEFSWLTDSNIWLKSLEKIYSENKIPGDLEMFLNKFIFLLNELSVCNDRFKDLWKLLEQRVWLSRTSDMLDDYINKMPEEPKNKTFFGRTITN